MQQINGLFAINFEVVESIENIRNLKIATEQCDGAKIVNLRNLE